jgi:ribA/ribD-fused uncharacterized protein
MEKRILPFDLYEKYLSAFSAHSIEYKGTLYQTVEHAYHCQKYSDPVALEKIKNARSAYLAWEISQTYKAQQTAEFDEKKVSLMEEICRAKLAQHADVRQLLSEAKGKLIIKNYPDPFWGIGMNGEGRNEMGKLWMRLCEELK